MSSSTGWAIEISVRKLLSEIMGWSCSPFGMHLNLKACNLNITHYAIGLCYCLLSSDIRHGRHCVFALHVHLVFVTKYRSKVFDGGAIQRLKVMFEKVCTDFEAQLVEMNGEARTRTCSSTTRRSTRGRAWSTVSKAFPVGCSVSSGLILRNAIGRMSCGHRLTLPPVVAGHRWASSSNTLSNKRPRFNRPYIHALKDRGFTARLVISMKPS